MMTALVVLERADLKTELTARAGQCAMAAQSVRACRTQIVTEVGDAEKMAANWSKALDTEDAMTLLHRVVFYGDHMDSIGHLARLMGMNVIEEG